MPDLPSISGKKAIKVFGRLGLKLSCLLIWLETLGGFAHIPAIFRAG